MTPEFPVRLRTLVRRSGLLSIIGGLVVFLDACAPAPTLPGTALGTYSVVGTLGANTCGSGINAINPWNVTFDLSEDSTTLYLAKTDGSDEVFGPLATSGTTPATLTSVVTANVDGNDAGAAGPCNLTLSTSFSVLLPSGAMPPTFTGTALYSYSVATVSASSNCTDQLSDSGGQYATLPCTVSYTLTGTRQ
jgi:hypothetical protein